MKRIILLFLLPLGLAAQKILVSPYLQPGNAPGLNYEEKVIIWQTNAVPGDFKIEYGQNFEYDQTGVVTSVNLKLKKSETILYRATLKGLSLDSRYFYRLTLNKEIIFRSEFGTRTQKPETRFAVFGDCGIRSVPQAEVAFQVSRMTPQFVLITGDNIYYRGRMKEYLAKYFRFYNADQISRYRGVPLMRSVPFYLTVGNHDVGYPDLDRYPDGLACFYYFDLPLNAPVFRKTITPAGDTARVKAFKETTSPRFPGMANYSFDHGNVHIVCLDANRHSVLPDPEMIAWLEQDLNASTATWKLVAFHQPGFNSSIAHYDAQWMRILAPALEKSGVDLVLSGHVHNYQRSRPLRFKPDLGAAGNPLISSSGRVNGAFTLDVVFDGKMETTPEGVIYIVTGAGGAPLYDMGFSNQPELWEHEPPENWVPFTAKMISDIHSFTLIETGEHHLLLRQVDKTGKTIDEIRITK